MRCPACKHPESRVLESRESEETTAIRRRRSCLSCGHRFTTYERIETSYLMVVKKNQQRELFDRNKLTGGIYKAFEKRPVPAAKIEQLITNIEQTLRTEYDTEVSTKVIGELVMKKVIEIDDVAYVRFASVYRSFRTLRSFEAELARLRARKQRP